MASSRNWRWISSLIAALTPAAVSITTGAALASQGPGGGPGTASPFMQLVMAIIVYGAAALVAGGALVGALRRG